MSKGFQSLTLIGNVGKDPETREAGGKPVTTFTLAVTLKAGSEEFTQWYKVSCWDGLAGVASQYITKGKQVFVMGRFKVREWTGNDGKTRVELEFTCRELQLLGGGGEANGERHVAKEDELADTPF
jgi:single-strand DNA-binding protein